MEFEQIDNDKYKYTIIAGRQKLTQIINNDDFAKLIVEHHMISIFYSMLHPNPRLCEFIVQYCDEKLNKNIWPEINYEKRKNELEKLREKCMEIASII